MWQGGPIGRRRPAKPADALSLLIALEERVTRIYSRFFRAFRSDPKAARCW